MAAESDTRIDVAYLRRTLAPHGFTLVDAETVPAELFVTVVDALAAAAQELEQLQSTEMPLPEPVMELLREHAAMKATLAGAGNVAKLRESYLREIDRVISIDAPGPTVTLVPGVLDTVDDAWETLRRAALTDRVVDATLRRTTAW